MTDEELIARLRRPGYLAFNDGTDDYGTAPNAADRIEALVKALNLAANRLDRRAVDYIPGGRLFIKTSEWAAEARAALAALEGRTND